MDTEEIIDAEEAMDAKEAMDAEEIKKKLESTFKIIKETNWSEAHPTFFIIKRGNLIKRSAKYKVNSVAIDEILSGKFKNIISNKIRKANRFQNYDFTTGDMDDDFLAMLIEDTDIEKIIPKLISIENHDDVSRPDDIKKMEDIMDAKIYVIRLESGELKPLFCFRYLATSWASRNVFSKYKAVFKGGVLASIDEKEIFKIDGKIDFFVYDGAVFIADKKHFETALNFREGLKEMRDDILEKFEEFEVLDNTDFARDCIGDHMSYLRKLAQIKKSEYYKDEVFLAELKKINENEKWGIDYSEDGKIIVTEENVNIVLHLLNNDMLYSKLTKEDYLISSKEKVEKS